VKDRAMPDTATERLPFVRLLDNGREAVLEIPSEAAPEITTPDALIGLVRERGVLLDRSVDEAVRSLAAQHASRAAGDAADISGTVSRWVEPVPGTDARIDWAEEFRPAAEASAGDDAAAPVAG